MPHCPWQQICAPHCYEPRNQVWTDADCAKFNHDPQCPYLPRILDFLGQTWKDVYHLIFCSVHKGREKELWSESEIEQLWDAPSIGWVYHYTYAVLLLPILSSPPQNCHLSAPLTTNFTVSLSGDWESWLPAWWDDGTWPQVGTVGVGAKGGVTPTCIAIEFYL